MMKNFSLFASVWLVVATVSFTACQSDDEASHAASVSRHNACWESPLAPRCHLAQKPSYSTAPNGPDYSTPAW